MDRPDSRFTPWRRRTDGERRDDVARLKALIVDDDPNYCVYIGAVASRLGFQTAYASDGAAALNAVHQAHFDLLLVDYSMPRLNGVEVIAAVRADETMADTYAVMVTGHDDVESKLTALGAGYDDFMSKAATEAEVVAKLASARRIVSRQQALDTAVRTLYGLATRDELTGVFNRRFFIEESERLLAEGAALSVVLFDLDGFKIINDTHGHLAGDQILRDVGALFLRSTRAEDLLARYGGDEFVMAVGTLTPAQVEQVAARLARDIAELHWNIGETSVSITVTIGIAASTYLPGTSLSQLLNAADRDLYKNKWLRSHPEQQASERAERRHESAMLVEPRPARSTE